MQIEINPRACNGCGICAEICPCDVFRLQEGSKVSEAIYVADCWYCGSCERDCPTGAITVALPYLVA
jgi:NAD-dependent dihydropyrimidine dehydrogenase PreA subunit